MPGRFAVSRPTASLFTNGHIYQFSAHIAHDVDMPILHYYADDMAPLIDIIPGRSTGLRVEIRGPGVNPATLRFRFRMVQLNRDGREVFRSDLQNGILAPTRLRATSSFIYAGHGPAVPTNGNYTLTLVVDTEDGPVRLDMQAPVAPSDLVRFYYGYPYAEGV